MSNALRPWAFAYLYDALVPVAREHGYALALHGSMARDLDLIAVPWTEEAATSDVLIAAITEAAGGFLIEHSPGTPREGRDPTLKPHGRLAWSIHLKGQPYIDISVMPLTARGENAPHDIPESLSALSVRTMAERDRAAHETCPHSFVTRANKDQGICGKCGMSFAAWHAAGVFALGGAA